MKNLYTIVLSLLSISLFAQDLHFSQNSVGLRLNPAYTGALETGVSYRIAAAYRNQWRPVSGNEAYNTYLIAADGRFCNSDSKGYFALGGSVARDVAGETNFTTDEVNLGLAYHRDLGGGFLILGGFGLEYVDYSLDENSLMFNEQFGSNGYDPNLPNNENFMEDNAYYFDMAAGVGMAWNNGNNINLNGGLSYRHFFLPTYYFLNDLNLDENRVYSRFVANFGSYFSLKSGGFNRLLAPRAILQMQGKQWNTLLGTDFIFDLTRSNKWDRFSPGNTHLDFGVYARLSNASNTVESKSMVFDGLVAKLSAKFDLWQIGVSYDMNMSNLSDANRFNNAFELTFSKMFRDKDECLYCPTY